MTEQSLRNWVKGALTGCPASGSLTTSFSATSPTLPTCCGSRTSRICGRGRGGCYLAAVQDAFSRRIVGWAMADHMRAELVVDALQMAVSRRRPEPGLIHHSDQGSQYVSLGFGHACAAAGISRSMGSRGDCWDNAVAETFFATLKKELVYRRSWPTRQELISEIFEYIEALLQPPAPALHPRLPLTRRVRRHSPLDGMKNDHSHNNMNNQPSTTTLGPQALDCPPKRGKSMPEGARELAFETAHGASGRVLPSASFLSR